MRAFFIDIQGTLIDDAKRLPLPGAVEFLKYLNSRKIPFVLVTNNSKYDSKDFMDYLHNLGFEFGEDNYIDPLMIIENEFKNITLKPYGNKNFVKIISEKFNVSDNPDALLLAIKIFTPDQISEIIEYLLNGARLYGMHKTSLFAKNNRRYPGLGAVLEMLKFATGRDYEVFGKPSLKFFEKAKEKIGVNFDKITIISDDLYGDLLPAKKLGMKSILVLSGKVKSKNEISEKPDGIYENLGEYLNKG